MNINNNPGGSGCAQRGPRPKQKIAQHYRPPQHHYQVGAGSSSRPPPAQQQVPRQALATINIQPQPQLHQQSAPFPNCTTDVLTQVITPLTTNVQLGINRNHRGTRKIKKKRFKRNQPLYFAKSKFRSVCWSENQHRIQDGIE